MGSCREDCVCNTCEFNLTCETCKCVPKRVCIALWPGEGESCGCNQAPVADPDGPVQLVEFHWGCDSGPNGSGGGAYSGTLTCGGSADTFPIYFYYMQDLDTRLYYAVLHSDSLGYSFDGVTDTRLKVLLGGPDGTDHAMRRQQCRNPAYDFTVDLSLAFPECGEALITVRPSNQLARPQKLSRPTAYPSCSANCICLTHIAANGVVHRATGCWDGYLPGWTVGWPYENESWSGKVAHVVLETEEGFEPAVVRLYSSFGDMPPQEVECSAFFTEWTFEDGSRLRMSRSSDTCTDCKCYCRCVCINYSNGESAPRVMNACWDDGIGGWTAVFVPDEDIGDPEGATVTVFLECDEETKTTVLRIETSVAATDELFPPDPVPANCPDIASVWIMPDGFGSISITCNPCDRCFDPGEASSCCYGDMPRTIYATYFAVSPTGEPVPPVDRPCDPVDGSVIAMSFNEQTQMWVGSGTPFGGCPYKVFNIFFRCGVDAEGNNVAVFGELGGGESLPGEITCNPFSYSSGVLAEAGGETFSGECCDTEQEVGYTAAGLYMVVLTE